jgi:ABC-2 type transport system ATP-binding protein
MHENDIILVTNASDYCIEVDKLYKKYNNNIQAINGISFTVRYGEIFGFLGPNGAGKTTTIKILTTLVPPSAGNVYLFGKDILKRRQEIRKRIGIILQKPSFEPNLTVEKSLNLYATLWHVGKDIKEKRIKDILKTFDLEDIQNRKNEDLSIGLRRRVQIAREFVHDMDLLFLDEPTVGLDPESRRQLLDYVKSQVRKGLTVFFTTHIMEEAEYLCDRIAIIDKGNIIALDRVSEIKDKYGGIKSIEITFEDKVTQVIIDLLNIATDNQYKIQTPKPNIIKIGPISSNKILIKIIDIFSKNNIEIENIYMTSSSLEEVFLNITNNSRLNR